MSCACDSGEHKGFVKFAGNPMTLLGNINRVGMPAPDFTVVGNDLAPVKLSAYKGKKILISVVPSLDTGVCDLQTRRFNTEAGKYPNVKILAISMDLPFAQKRWCGAAGVENLVTLSDYKDADFGMKYGLLIKELRLLARAVLVIDEKGNLVYQDIVPEMTNHPDYDKALAALK